MKSPDVMVVLPEGSMIAWSFLSLYVQKMYKIIKKEAKWLSIYLFKIHSKYLIS